jgi:transcription initiation factor TFIID subunit 6
VALPSTGTGQQLYHIPDEEVDFSTFLKQPLPAGLAGSAGAKWKAHWLAVEGVQPAIPENPTPSRAGRELIDYFGGSS